MSSKQGSERSLRTSSARIAGIKVVKHIKPDELDTMLDTCLATLTADSGIVITGSAHAVSAPLSPQELGRGNIEEDDLVFVVYTPDMRAMDEQYFPPRRAHSSAPHERAQVALFAGEFTEGEDDAVFLLWVSGAHSTGSAFVSSLIAAESTVISFPTTAFADLESGMDNKHLAGQLLIKDEFCVVGDVKQIYTLLRLSSANRVTKTLSILRFFYGWVKQHINQYAIVLTAEEYARHHQDYRCQKGDELTDQESEYFMVITTAYLLATAYSIDDNYSLQVAGRFSAIMSTIGAPVPDKTTVAAIVNTLNLRVSSRPALLNMFMGYWLSINDDLQYDPTIKEEDLAKPDDLMKKGYIQTEFAHALMTQGRLVYFGAGLTSIRWAFENVKKVQRFLSGLSAAWQQEIRGLSEQEDLITQYNYTGLRYTQAESIQIAKFPRMALLGIRAYQRSLQGEAHRLMNAYNTKFAETYLTAVELDMVNALAKIVAVSMEDVYVELINSMNYEAANHMLTEVPLTHLEKVKSRIKAHPTPGPWAKYELEQERTQALLAMYQELAGRLEAKYRTRAEHLQSQINNIIDLEERMNAINLVSTWRNDCTSQLETFVPAALYLSMMINHKTQDEYETASARAVQVMDKIRDTPRI